MAPRRLLPYGPRIVNILHNQLPALVAGESGLVGGVAGAHHAEAVIQHLMVKVLAPHIPSPDLIRNNKKVLDHPTLGGCIPDVIIDCIGGTPWAFFELKTLLSDDQLNEAAVDRDLKKLCAYKETYPEAAAVFTLVGTRKNLFANAGKQAWQNSGVRYEEAAFSSSQLRPQLLGSGFAAIPCGWSGKATEVISLTWEIQPIQALKIQSDTYRFIACMAGTP